MVALNCRDEIGQKYRVSERELEGGFGLERNFYLREELEGGDGYKISRLENLGDYTGLRQAESKPSLDGTPTGTVYI